MSLKNLLSWAIAGIGVLLMVFYLFELQQTFAEVQQAEKVHQAIQNYHISIWCGWILITSSAIYNRWKNRDHTIFVLDYLLMITAFFFLGYYLDQGETNNLWSLGEAFQQGVVFIVSRNILLICLMTAFIHAAIWWFSKRWHRQ